MKLYIPLLLGTLAVAGCTTIHVPLRTQADPQAAISKAATFAFLEEPDLRIQKRLFYERATKYLAGAGYRMVDPRSADYLVRVTMASRVETRIEIDANWVTPHIAGANTTVQKIPADMTFTFAVYRRADIENRRIASVWEASVDASDQDFRNNEERCVLGIFDRLGATFDGKLALTK